MKPSLLTTLFIHRSFSVGGLITLFLFTFTTSAQSFQWAKRGGSTNTLQRTQDYNNVIDMVTDQAGNAYLLCRVGASNLQVDGHSLRAYSAIGIGDNRDILLTSFSKEGQYRWSKVIGGKADDVGTGLKTMNGYVYLTGRAQPYDTAFFSTDTFVVSDNNGYSPKSVFLIQYDTAGTFKWLIMPESDTIPQLDFGGLPYWIDVAPNGDIYWLCYLKPGALPGTGQTVTAEGTYVIRYNQNGQFQSRVQLDVKQYGQFRFDGLYNEGNFIRDHQTGNYYLGGTHDYSGTLTIGNDTIKGLMYLAVFDSVGQVVWKKESNDITGAAEMDDFKLDASGNIFITGTSKDGAMAFNNQPFTSPSNSAAPFIMKLNSSGATLWEKLGVVQAVSPGNALIVNQGEVAITGFHGGLYWQGPNDLDTLMAVPNQGYDAFIARFDTQSGDLLGMESAQTNFGGASYGYSITADSEGSYYLGGNFDQQLFLGTDSLYKIGSQRSFFVTKYACGIPEASFTVGSDSVAYLFNYTGTPADSVLWDFGDGSAPYKGDSVSHVYSTKGQYIVCATAYDGCGDTTTCDTLDVTTIDLDEFEVEKTKLLQLAPNPATNEVSVIYELPEWTETSIGSLEVHDLRGARVAEYPITKGEGTEHVQLANWTASVYIVILRVDGEVKDYRRLVIQ